MKRSITLKHRVSRFASVCTALVLLLPPDVARAQFNPQGRGSRPTKRNAPPRRQTSKSAAPAKRSASNNPRTTRSSAERLIIRYQRMVIEQPDEDLPYYRLKQLLEARDGSLQPYLLELEQKPQSLPHQLARARLLLLDERAPAALALLNSLLPRFAQSPRLRKLMAQAKKDLGDLQGSFESLEKLLTLKVGGKNSALLRELRELALDLFQFEQAQLFQTQLMRAEPGGYPVLVELALALEQRGEDSRALRHYLLLEAKLKRSDLPRLYRDIARVSLRKGDLDTAGAYLKKAETRASTRVQRELALLSLQYHRQTNQLQSYVEELKARARTRNQWRQVGEIFEELSQTNQAEAAYQQALALDKNALEERLALIALYEATGNLNAAIEQYQTIFARQLEDITITLQGLELYQTAGKLALAQQLVRNASKRYRGQADELLLLLDAAESFEMLTLAEVIEAQLERLHSNNYEVLIELGERAYANHQEERAFQLFLRARQSHPVPREGLRIYIQLLLDHQENHHALEVLTQLQAAAPEESWLKLFLARAYGRAAATSLDSQRRLYNAEAEKLWLELLSSVSGSNQAAQELEAQRQLLRIWSAQKTLSEKVETLRLPWLPALNSQAADEKERVDTQKTEREVDQKSAPQLRLVAAGLIRLERLKEASDLLQFLLKRRSADAATLELFLKVSQKSHHDDLALGILEKLRLLNPSRQADYLNQISLLYQSSGQTQRALQAATEAIAHAKDRSAAYEGLGDLCLANGALQKAESAYRKSLSSHLTQRNASSFSSRGRQDAHARISLKLAEVLTDLNQQPEALTLYLTSMRLTQDEVVRERALIAALAIGQGHLRSIEKSLRPLVRQNVSSRSLQIHFLELLREEIDQIEFNRQRQQLTLEQAKQENAAVIDRSLAILLRLLNSDRASIVEQSLYLLQYGESSECQLALLNFALGKGFTSTTIEQRKQALLMIGSRRERAMNLNLAELARSPLALTQLSHHAAWLLARLFQLQPNLESLKPIREFLRRSSNEASLYLILGLNQTLSGASDANKEQGLLVAELYNLLQQSLLQKSPRLRAATFYALSAPQYSSLINLPLKDKLEKSGLLRSKDPLVFKLAHLASLRHSLRNQASSSVAVSHLQGNGSFGAQQAMLHILAGEELFLLPQVQEARLPKLKVWLQQAGSTPLTEERRLSLFLEWQSPFKKSLIRGITEQSLTGEELSNLLLSPEGQLIAAPFILAHDHSQNSKQLAKGLHRALQPALLDRVQQGPGVLYAESLALIDVDSPAGFEQLKDAIVGITSASQQEQQALLMALSRTHTIQGQNLLYTLAENRALTWSLRRRSLTALGKTQASHPISSAHCTRLRKLTHDSSALVAQQALKMNKSAACSPGRP